MSARSTLIFGILLVLLPFIGMPLRWFRVLLPILGGIYIVYAFHIYTSPRDRSRQKHTPRQPSLFTAEKTEEPLTEERINKQEAQNTSPEQLEVNPEEQPELSLRHGRLAAQMIAQKIKHSLEQESFSQNFPPPEAQPTKSRWARFESTTTPSEDTKPEESLPVAQHSVSLDIEEEIIIDESLQGLDTAEALEGTTPTSPSFKYEETADSTTENPLTPSEVALNTPEEENLEESSPIPSAISLDDTLLSKIGDELDEEEE